MISNTDLTDCEGVGCFFSIENISIVVLTCVRTFARVYSNGWRSVAQVEDEDAFDEEIDTLKFRLVLRPETDENNEASVDPASLVPGAAGINNNAPSGTPTSTSTSGSAPSALPLHRLMIQTVGGRSCSQVWMVMYKRRQGDGLSVVCFCFGGGGGGGRVP